MHRTFLIIWGKDLPCAVRYSKKGRRNAGLYGDVGWDKPILPKQFTSNSRCLCFRMSHNATFRFAGLRPKWVFSEDVVSLMLAIKSREILSSFLLFLWGYYDEKACLK